MLWRIWDLTQSQISQGLTLYSVLNDDRVAREQRIILAGKQALWVNAHALSVAINGNGSGSVLFEVFCFDQRFGKSEAVRPEHHRISHVAKEFHFWHPGLRLLLGFQFACLDSGRISVLNFLLRLRFARATG